MTKANLRTEERFWNIAVTDNVISIEYGLNDSDEAKESSVEITEGKAGRTVEQEAIKNAYNRVSKQVEKGYEGDISEIETAYKNMIEEVEAAKAQEKAEKEKAKVVEKAKAKVERLQEKVDAKREALEIIEAELAEAKAIIADSEEVVEAEAV